jgi:hypothetical protein
MLNKLGNNALREGAMTYEESGIGNVVHRHYVPHAHRFTV